MGKPDNPDRFVPIEIGEWGRRYGILYVAREVWERLRPGAREFTFYVPDGGRCRILFDRPVSRLHA